MVAAVRAVIEVARKHLYDLPENVACPPGCAECCSGYEPFVNRADVQRIADHIGILVDGTLKVGEPLDHLAETVLAMPDFEGRNIRPETFAVLLVQHIPAHVRLKLEGWGVLDFCALFRRSIGLHAIFQEIPKAEDFSPEFLRRYHRYLDQWYEQRLRDWVFERPKPEDYSFDLYASGEYAMMLEQSWNTGESKSK